MSAFLVSRDHIDALVRLALADTHSRMRWTTVSPDSDEWPQLAAGGDLQSFTEYQAAVSAVTREARYDAADEIGRMLAVENAASVLYRYPDHDNSDYVPAWTTDGTYTYVELGPMPTPVEGLKILSCFEYQSCEHPGWKDSEARRFCDALRMELIARLPGYSEAPWEWSTRRPSAA